MDLHIGTASWQIPKPFSHEFPQSEASVLTRYAETLNGVEINSSFYKEHKQQTYERWRDSVPTNFKFSVKLSRAFTHDNELHVGLEDLKASVERIQGLREKLAVLLVQLPPSLVFEAKTATAFFKNLRKLHDGPIALEPRHYTWLLEPALKLMTDLQLSKVFADPAPCPLPISQSPLSGVAYFRLHGSPQIYKSEYSKERLLNLNHKIKNLQHDNVWVIFDNTTFGFATKNALELAEFTGLRGSKSGLLAGGDRWASLDDRSSLPQDNDRDLL